MLTAPSTEGIKTILAAVRSAPHTLKGGEQERLERQRPFVTISREAGAGGHSVGQRLVERLNELDPGPEPWTLWDRQLVEKVAADHHVGEELIEAIGQHQRSWMEEFLVCLSTVEDVSESRIYRIVATAIRALATKGRVVIVGRGGVFLTRNMPGGVHLRLVADLKYRIKNMSRVLGVDTRHAEEYVRRLDHERNLFYRRYWPKEVTSAESFTLTINTGVIDEDYAVESVIPLILHGAHVVAPSAAAQTMAVGA